MLKNIMKILASVFLFWLSFICMSLPHSAGFELGVALVFVAAFHWMFW